MEKSGADGIPVNVFIKRGIKPDTVIPAVEAAGLFDTSIPEYLRIIFGKVATREAIPQIAQVPGVEDALEDVQFYPVLESK